MKSSEIRTRFLQFFKNREHAVIPSASLVTSDDRGVTNATLFNSAGMQPLVPFLLGKPHPLGKRLANSQKCLRTVDIDDVGDNTHATFFEMLGNWSLGDYFKQEAISWSYEFLTSKSEGLGLDPNKLYVTVFEGDSNAPKDDEAAEIWREIFRKNNVTGHDANTQQGQAGRIFYMPAENNWWEAGANGPCGPDSEMFYDVTNRFAGRAITKDEYLDADRKRDVVEVWNDVFMQYEKKEGKIVGKLPKPSVDTGAGLERLAMVMQNVDNIYGIDLFIELMRVARGLTDSEANARIISDHMRSSIFLISDGVLPSNTDRGYILRRLIRRATFHTKTRNIDPASISAMLDACVDIYSENYPAIAKHRTDIEHILNEEINRFTATLEQGTREFKKLSDENISGIDAFKLFSSYGLPIDLTVELAKEQGLSVDTKGFENEFIKHQNLSRIGADKKFKGGLANQDDMMIVRYHTATHLLHQALHDVLGSHVEQKGSNITGERLRFDFSHNAKMTDIEKRDVEAIVNKYISMKVPVKMITMDKIDAEKIGARHLFDEKYSDQISVYYIGDSLETAYSKEFCGGPHVDNTSELAGPDGKWTFHIKKEESVAQGIRRIKAVLE